jgi:hypothetical protein
MNQDREKFLNLRQLPARLNTEETAWYLGFGTKEIPHLTKARLLKPLGNPSRCATKFFATVRLRRLRDDEPWLNRACATIFANSRRLTSHRLRQIARKGSPA